MDLKKNREYINGKLIEIYNCNDIDKFYELCTGLYYHINDLVFNLSSKLLNNDEVDE